MKYNFVLPKNLNNDLIGSGLISRRVIIKKIKKNKFHELSKRTLVSAVKENKKKPIFFNSVEVKLIYEFWNTCGFPFVKHKLVKGKTSEKIIHEIIFELKKNSRLKIINAINNGKFLFNAPWFKYKNYYAKHKISLSNFIKFNNNYNFSKKTDFPISWLSECYHNKKYLERKYTTIKKDRFPHITKKIEAIWKTFTHNEIDIIDKNIIIVFSKKVYLFSKNNDYSWEQITNLIDKMLNYWKNIKPKNLNFFIQSFFWEKIMPNELIRYGIADKNKKFKF